jgi:hypothetical protein
MKLVALGAVLATLVLGTVGPARAGQGVPYTIVPRSSVLQFCPTCTEPAGRPEALTGSFTLTPVSFPDGVSVEALTDVRWESPSFKITGSGFVQYDPSGRVQVELEATINGEEMRLRATRRQPPGRGSFTVVLATPREAAVGYLIVLTAKPDMPAVSDADFDGVGDNTDNCRGLANAAQADADFDGVGDACDQCPDTSSGAMVNGDGCSVEQLCPCEGPRDGGAWRRGAYAKCVARAVRDLRRLGLVSRGEAGTLIRRSLQNGCGQTVLAGDWPPACRAARLG